jgi:hypothetical protein
MVYNVSGRKELRSMSLHTYNQKSKDYTAEKEIKAYKTEEDFAKGFIPAYKQALKLSERKARGEKLENNAYEWINSLIVEMEETETAEVKKSAD